jgi:hypothetical protein
VRLGIESIDGVDETIQNECAANAAECGGLAGRGKRRKPEMWPPFYSLPIETNKNRILKLKVFGKTQKNEDLHV